MRTHTLTFTHAEVFYLWDLIHFHGRFLAREAREAAEEALDLDEIEMPDSLASRFKACLTPEERGEA